MTLAELRFATLTQLGDASGDDAFYPDEELNLWLNEGLTSAHNALRFLLPEEYYDAPQPMDGDEDEPGLPAEYHHLLPIWATARGLRKAGDASGERQKLAEFRDVITQSITALVLATDTPDEIS